MKLAPEAGDALIVVDMQNDFLPGGRLPVPRGDEVVPVLKRVLAAFVRARLPVFATRDWHPANHCSFREQGGPWPPHCVQGSPGARFAPGLGLPPDAVTVSTADTPEREAYSSFDGTDLARRLRAAGVRRLWVGGLATDYCVLCTVRDARAAGFEVLLLTDAVRAIDVQPGDGERAVEEMRRAGAVTVTSEELA